jgi:hypothetical protein
VPSVLIVGDTAETRYFLEALSKVNGLQGWTRGDVHVHVARRVGGA